MDELATDKRETTAARLVAEAQRIEKQAKGLAATISEEVSALVGAVPGTAPEEAKEIAGGKLNQVLHHLDEISCALEASLKELKRL